MCRWKMWHSMFYELKSRQISKIKTTLIIFKLNDSSQNLAQIIFLCIKRILLTDIKTPCLLFKLRTMTNLKKN